MAQGWIVTVDNAREINRYTRAVHLWDELREELQKLADRGYGVILVGTGEKRDFLQIGIAGDVAFVEFEPHSPPFGRPVLWAITDENSRRERDEYVEFNVGDTATPIPTRYTVPIPLAVAIARHYFETETLPQGVRWLKDRE